VQIPTKVAVSLTIGLVSVCLYFLFLPNRAYDLSVRNNSKVDFDWVDVQFDTGFKPPVGVLSSNAWSTTIGIEEKPQKINISWRVGDIRDCKNIIFSHKFPENFPGKISSLMIISFTDKSTFSVSLIDATKQKEIHWGDDHSMVMSSDYRSIDLEGKYTIEDCS
jgi:hypothetical protein